MDFVYPNPPINYLDFSDRYDFLNLRRPKSESFRIKMDVSVENINYAGVMNEFIGGISTALVNKWQERFTAMHKMAVFMKYVFNEHGFNNSYKGKFLLCFLLSFSSSSSSLLPPSSFPRISLFLFTYFPTSSFSFSYTSLLLSSSLNPTFLLLPYSFLSSLLPPLSFPSSYSFPPSNYFLVPSSFPPTLFSLPSSSFLLPSNILFFYFK